MQTQSLEQLAFSIARDAHAGQFRRDGETPYIEHPVAVRDYLERFGVTGPLILAAALLHDVLEDTKVTEQDLRSAGIPESVVEAVKVLTKGKEPHRIYIKRVKENRIARQVKWADMICNLADSPRYQQAVRYVHDLYYLTFDHPDLYSL